MILTEKPKEISVGQANDLTNQKFGSLTVLYRCEKPINAKSRGAYWYCHCDCGNNTIVRADGLKSGVVISCGCLGIKHRADSVKRDLTNYKFGELTALYPTNKRQVSTGAIMWHCKCSCGRELDVPTNALTTGNTTSCGHFKLSKGAKSIEDILLKYNINFVKEKTFKECRDKSVLRFDFYLPDYNICIEYDGEQHFKKASAGFFKDRLEDIQKKDRIKDQYCLNHNIKIIRISYLEQSQTKAILEQELKLTDEK